MYEITTLLILPWDKCNNMHPHLENLSVIKISFAKSKNKDIT